MVVFVERPFGTVRDQLLAVPGKLAGDLDPDQVERVRAELYEAMEELSDPRRVLDEFDILSSEAGGDADEAETSTQVEPN